MKLLNKLIDETVPNDLNDIEYLHASVFIEQNLFERIVVETPLTFPQE